NPLGGRRFCHVTFHETRSIDRKDNNAGRNAMITRRRLLENVSAGAALAGFGATVGLPRAEAAGLSLSPALPSGVHGEAALEALPGKKPLIKLSYRPPNYETPIDYFREPITPNDAFFVRYHLSNIPDATDKAIDPKTWKVTV